MNLTGLQASHFRRPPVTDIPPRLVLVAIDKGGVGKSFFCIQLISWLRSIGIPYTAYDPDHANSSLSRFIHDAIFINARHSENLDAMVEQLSQTPVVILDGMVGRQGLVFDWMEETNLCEVANSLGFSVTMTLVIEDDKDAVHQAGEAVKRFGHRVDWLVVKNHKVTNFFNIYQKSKARQNLLDHGAKEIELLKLDAHLNEFLQSQSVTIEDALATNELHLIDRQRLLAYQRNLYITLDSVRDLLI